MASKTYVLQAKCQECGHINSRYSSVIPFKGYCDYCKKDLVFKRLKYDHTERDDPTQVQQVSS